MRRRFYDDFDDGPGAYGYNSWDEAALYEAFDGDIDAYNNWMDGR